MTVGELVKYLECIPVETSKQYSDPDEALRNMEIMVRVPSASGSYNCIVNLVKLQVETLPHYPDKKIIIVDTGYVQ